MDQPTISNPSASNPSSPEGSSPFQMPPEAAAPEPMGEKPVGQPTISRESVATPPASPVTNPPNFGPKKPIFAYLLIGFLILVLIGSIIIFVAWKGWISLGGFGGSKPIPLPSTASSPKLSPAISPFTSPQVSPSATSTPKITSNINDETRKKDLVNIKSALKKYYLAQAQYPISSSMIKTSDKTSVLAQALAPAYLTALPDDPQTPQFYYGYKSDGQTFELTAALEDKSDSSGTIIGSYNIYKLTDSSVE